MSNQHHGDGGKTNLYGGPRVSKTHQIFAALGAVDELNSVLGLVLSTYPQDEHATRLAWIQERLFALGSDLANPEHAEHSDFIDQKDVTTLDEWLESYRSSLPPLQHFILPGGAPAAASVNVGRAICRRAERETLRLGKETSIRPEATIFLNRLSDVLFEMARAINHDAGTPEPEWIGPRDRKTRQK